MRIDVDELLTAQEVADMARVHLKTFRRWCRNGDGPKEKRLGPNTIRYAESDVRAWVQCWAVPRESVA